MVLFALTEEKVFIKSIQGNRGHRSLWLRQGCSNNWPARQWRESFL